MKITHLTTALLSLLFLSCQEKKADQQAEAEKLMEISREWSRSAAGDDIDKTLSYWADDAVVMSPGAPPIKGKQAIREMVEGMKNVPGFRISWEPLSAEVSESGDMAYLIEQNQVTMNDSAGNPQTTAHKAVTIWKKGEDGTWKNVVDMWN